MRLRKEEDLGALQVAKSAGGENPPVPSMNGSTQVQSTDRDWFIITEKERAFLETLPITRRPVALLGWVAQRIVPLADTKKITELRYWRMDDTVDRMLEHYHTTDIIASTPVPFPYAHLILWLTLVYICMLPFMLVRYFLFFTPFMTSIMTFFLWGINEVALEIEDPFGYDKNDLPLDVASGLIRLDSQLYLEMQATNVNDSGRNEDSMGNIIENANAVNMLMSVGKKKHKNPKNQAAASRRASTQMKKLKGSLADGDEPVMQYDPNGPSERVSTASSILQA